MSIVWRFFLWACVVWIVPLLYFLLRNETRPKKNLVMGVTLPCAARESPEVLARCAKFRRQLGWLCGILTAASLPMILLDRFSLSMTWMMVWILLVCVLPHVPYALCNRDLKALKTVRSWGQPAPPPTAVDLKAAAIPAQWQSPLWFLPPFLASLIPVLAAFRTEEPVITAIYALDAASILLFYMCYRWLYRNRAEMVDDDTDLTVALTRLRRRQWGRCWIGLAWLTGLFNVGLWLTIHTTWPMMAVILIYTTGVVLLTAGVELRVRRLQEKLTAHSGQGFYVDEDDRWIWGLIYYNPNDSRLLVNARTGINTTINLARRSGQVLAAITVLTLLCLPLIGIWLIREESSPVELVLTDTAIVASHSGTRYEIPLDTVASVQLLKERPTMTRTMGASMDTVLKGRFSSPDLGPLTVCLDPRTGPYLHLITVDGKGYLLGNSDGLDADRLLAEIDP